MENYRAIEYSFTENNLITARLVGPLSAERPYWYIKKRLLAVHPDAKKEAELERFVRIGQKDIYWTESGWDYHTPKQFKTIEEAYKEYSEIVAPQQKANKTKTAEDIGLFDF